ncbi:pro-opiomelanocortin B isoform X2 [Syngnathus scovelli]|uniref:pro-opiomelanocortin B isoform X2 n=2 Tax=Syngnathus scovelli TaxID=161590 RepID=UPI00210FC202|nr:pro-opiomelanocortin B isoform X2 [Syngnathus scovelli]
MCKHSGEFGYSKKSFIVTVMPSNMECPCWLSVALVAFLSIPALGSECSICKNINRGRLLVCLELCKSASQMRRRPALSISEDKELSTLEAKAAERQRSYPVEHFRWSQPSGNGSREGRAGSRHAERSYSMEHFRWGKPPGNMTPRPKPGHKSAKRRHSPWGKLPNRKAFKGSAFPSEPPRARGHPGAKDVKNAQGSLTGIFGDILLKDVQRIVG